MTKSFLLLFLWITLSTAMADEAPRISTNERRVEEQKRLSLQPTEAEIAPKLPQARPPKEVINREFFNRLITQPIARKVDAVYAVMVLLGKQKDFTSLDAELVYLKDNGYIFSKKGETWELNQPLRKGELAYILCKALRIKGGVRMRLLGISPRYALFELVYMKIMISGAQDQVVSGRELAYSFIQASDYVTDKNTYDMSQ